MLGGKMSADIVAQPGLVAAKFAVSDKHTHEFSSSGVSKSSAASEAAAEGHSYTGRKDGGELPAPKQTPYSHLAAALEVRNHHLWRIVT